MTTTAFTDPVSATAVLAGITTMVGLGEPDLTCPTCHGRQCAVTIAAGPMTSCAFYYGHDGEHLTQREAEGYHTSCPDCTHGQRSLPVGPFPAALCTTSQEPPPNPWTHVNGPGGEDCGCPRCNPLAPSSSMVAMGTVEILPIVEDPQYEERSHVLLAKGRLTLWRMTGWPNDVEWVETDISSALPFGTWVGWALHVTDITTDTMPCPECEGAWSVSCPGPGAISLPHRLPSVPDRPCLTDLEIR